MPISAETTEFSSAMIRCVNVLVRPSYVMWSISTPSPIVYPKRPLVSRYGAFDMLSMPPASTTSWTPARICRSP